jgi:phosphonoacetaldehyde hydrolase
MANSPIKAFIFDWAGTMIDFGCCAPVIALQEAFADVGITISAAEARADMGMAKHAHINAILQGDHVFSSFIVNQGRAPDAEDVDEIFTKIEPMMIEAAAQHTTLIAGAADLVSELRSRGIRIGSGTGYSRSMMVGILRAAADQGYVPDTVVCAGETSEGRPSPLMTWKALVDLGVWPAQACIKVDDAVVGIHEGREAGTWTIGVAASGNGVGLDYATYCALDGDTRNALVAASAQALLDAGADYVVSSVADIPALLPELEARIRNGELPRRFAPHPSSGQLRL